MSPIELKDKELIENARSIINKRFKEDFHHVGQHCEQSRAKSFPLSIWKRMLGELRFVLKRLRSEWQRQQEIQNLKQ